MSTFKNPYAERIKDGKIVFIDDLSEAERGSKCGCICPCCKNPMIARMGTYNEHHFAHASHSDCLGGYESALHMMAKEIVEEGSSIMLPALKSKYVLGEGTSYLVLDNKIYNSFCYAPINITPDLGSVLVESTLEDIKPDVIVCYKGKKLIIEFLVTHAVDEKKKAKIYSLGISTVEIDLSVLADRVCTKEEIKSFIEKDTEHRKWIYNAKNRDDFVEKNIDSIMVLEKHKDRLKENIPISELGFQYDVSSSYVYGCPKARYFDGLQCYSCLQDCIKCSFFNGYMHKINDERNKIIFCKNKKQHVTPSNTMIKDFVLGCAEKVKNLPEDATWQDYWDKLDLYLEDLKKEYRTGPAFEEYKKEAKEKIMYKKFYREGYAWLEWFEIDCCFTESLRKIKYEFLEEYPLFKEIPKDKFNAFFYKNFGKQWNRQKKFVTNTKEHVLVDKYFNHVCGSVNPLKNESFAAWFDRCLLFIKRDDKSFDYEKFLQQDLSCTSTVSIVPYLANYAEEIWHRINEK